MPVLIFESSGEKFAIPQINITELVRVDSKSDTKIEKINNSPVLRLRGSLLPLIKLDNVLKANKNKTINEKNFIVVCEMGNFSFGVIVDKIFDSEEIVVKPVSTALRGINIYSGSTILGDGSVIMILDPNGLVKTISQTVHKNTKDEVKQIRDEDQPVSFLLFKAGSGAPKAVPLELVSRLEEISPKNIEAAGDIEVIQYRGDLMRLTRINETYQMQPHDSDKAQQFIVFNDEGKVMGIAVEEILDIVKQPMAISMNSTKNGFLGSMVIDGKTTDIIDIGHYFASVFKDWRIIQEEKDRTNRGGRILLVEDSAFFRKLMVPVLMTKGYEIKTASDGVQALKILAEDKNFHMIITDIDMPNMNGLEFSEKCKADPALRNIPIVALTANNNIETVRRSREIGIYEHIAKADREKLFKTVVDIIEPKIEAKAI